MKTKQLIIEIEPEMAERLERIAPARPRRRSEFIRMAIRKALWDLEERRTEEAYRRLPDTLEPAYFDAREWEPASSPPPRRRRRPGRVRRGRGGSR